MTLPTSQPLPFGLRWGQLLVMCPIPPVLWTRYRDMSMAWTYSGNVSISTSFLSMFCLAPAQREQRQQAARFIEFIWANLEEIGYGK